MILDIQCPLSLQPSALFHSPFVSRNFSFVREKIQPFSLAPVVLEEDVANAADLSVIHL